MKLYQRSFLQLQYYRELGIVTDFFFPFNLFIASTIPAREEYSTSWDMTNFTCFSNTTFLLIVFLVCNNKKAKMLWVMKSLFLGNVWHSGKCLIGEQSLCPSIHFLQPGGDFLKCVIFFFLNPSIYTFFLMFWDLRCNLWQWYVLWASGLKYHYFSSNDNSEDDFGKLYQTVYMKTLP